MDDATINDLLDVLGKGTSNSLIPGERALWNAQRDQLAMGLRRLLGDRQSFATPDPSLDYIGVESPDQLLTEPPSGS